MKPGDVVKAVMIAPHPETVVASFLANVNGRFVDGEIRFTIDLASEVCDVYVGRAIREQLLIAVGKPYREDDPR